MTEAIRRRPSGRTERNTVAVLNAVRQEVASYGYAQARVERIAVAAGVHKTTIYRRWGDKNRLIVVAAMQWATNRVAVPDTGDIKTDLVELLSRLALLLKGSDGAFCRAILAAQNSEPALAGELRRFWIHRLEAGAVVARRAIDRGDLPADCDPLEIIRHAMAPVHYRAHVALQPVTRATIRTAADMTILAARAGLFSTR